MIHSLPIEKGANPLRFPLREYVRGIYWKFMPDYRDRNHLRARRDLPEFYWTGETNMRCIWRCMRKV